MPADFLRGDEMDLQRSTWPEVEEYLQRRTDVIVPLGSTEQHGPAGLIGTDSLCPAFIARGAAERDGTLVAPAVAYGNAHHHLRRRSRTATPITTSVSPEPLAFDRRRSCRSSSISLNRFRTRASIGSCS
jgi:creatinine amidohydrolase/Fe(II)-dependent formamide hydrolase-like protein